VTPTIAAILGRFNGDTQLALEYCCDIIWFYPDLAIEYAGHARMLLDREPA